MVHERHYRDAVPKRRKDWKYIHNDGNSYLCDNTYFRLSFSFSTKLMLMWELCKILFQCVHVIFSKKYEFHKFTVTVTVAKPYLFYHYLLRPQSRTKGQIFFGSFDYVFKRLKNENTSLLIELCWQFSFFINYNMSVSELQGIEFSTDIVKKS